MRSKVKEKKEIRFISLSTCVLRFMSLSAKEFYSAVFRGTELEDVVFYLLTGQVTDLVVVGLEQRFCFPG